MSSTMDDHNKHVTGYPTTTYPPPPPQTNQHQPTAYPPPPQNSYPATGVGYPYRPPPPPPPAANYNPNPDPPQSNDPEPLTCPVRVLMVALILLVMVGAIYFIMRVIVGPQDPEIGVYSASVSNLSLSSSSQLTSNWEIGLLIRNPNKKASIYYDQIKGAVFYKDNSLIQKSLEPFFQNKKTERNLTSSFTASSTYVGDQTMMEIIRDRNNGGVNFNFEMLAVIRLKSGVWRETSRMRALCKNIKIEFLSSTSATGKLATRIKNCTIAYKHPREP